MFGGGQGSAKLVQGIVTLYVWTKYVELLVGGVSLSV